MSVTASLAVLWRGRQMRRGYRRLGNLNLILAEEALPAENEVGPPGIGG